MYFLKTFVKSIVNKNAINNNLRGPPSLDFFTTLTTHPPQKDLSDNFDSLITLTAITFSSFQLIEKKCRGVKALKIEMLLHLFSNTECFLNC
jgi:hypothetical protein